MQRLVRRASHSLFTQEGTSRRIRAGYSTSTDAEPKKRPRGFWSNLDNQRELLQKISIKLGVQEPADWYSVSRKEFCACGGTKLLFGDQGTLPLVLARVYPEVKWDAARFAENRLPPGYRQSKENLMNCLERAEKSLGIEVPEDWLSVRVADVESLGFPKAMGTARLVELLKEKYPSEEYEWGKMHILKGKYALQKRLERAIATLFPEVEIKTNVRKEGGVINPDTGHFLELDILVPSLNLALEFQEKHHYTSVSTFSDRPLEIIKRRDVAKQVAAAEKGITLISVPCWWDYSLESLAATIKLGRPDLAILMPGVADGGPIPDAPPPDFWESTTDTIEDVGEPVSPCFFINTDIDPAGWWVFEKYDGVRAFWNPLKKAFFSRKGNKFQFPPEVIDSMPTDVFLDGELWFGRENFHEATKIYNRREASCIDWDKFKYMIYDMPTPRLTYAERYSALKKVAEGGHKYIHLAEYAECKDIAHLESFFQDIIDQGGEGIILRDPNCMYSPGRSKGYLKHKKFRDAEARVVEVAGPWLWRCELPNGVEFTASPATSEFGRRWNPQPGDIVSFKHHGYLHASLKPKLPTLYRLRTDMTWDDVVRNWKEQISLPPKAPPLRRVVKRHKAKGYWRDPENKRKFFLEIAAEKGLDPYDPKTWQNITYANLRERNMGGLLSKSGGLFATLEKLFPGLKFEDQSHPQGYWQDIENRRKFFLDLAAEQGFDPYVPKNWLNVTYAQIVAKKGTTLVTHFNGLFRALKATFPDIVFIEKKTPRNYWRDMETRRNFLIKLAEEKGFDPFVASNWNSVTRADFDALKATTLLTNFGGLRNVIRKALPELNIQMRVEVPKAHWQDIDNRRAYFLGIAEEMGLNPQDPEAWMKLKQSHVLKKGGVELLTQFNGLQKALAQTFPELKFPTKKQPKGYWNDIENRKEFFLRISEELGFDPYEPKNWESVSTSHLRARKGGGLLAQFHGMSKALNQTFGFNVNLHR